MTDSRKRILIVEDERPIARAFELKLSHSGFEPVVTYDGEEALLALEKQKFDLILLDLIMPKMDGFAFLRELGKRKIKVPAIVTSNLGQEEDIRRAKELGAKDYFVKSDTPIADIVAHVEKVLKS